VLRTEHTVDQHAPRYVLGRTYGAKNAGVPGGAANIPRVWLYDSRQCGLDAAWLGIVVLVLLDTRLVRCEELSRLSQVRASLQILGC
jgi:hypothetical protein